MKADRGRRGDRRYRRYWWIFGLCLVLQVLVHFLQTNPYWVEYYYSRAFYPKFSFLSILIFSWLPFSAGDLIYGGLVVVLLFLLFTGLKSSFQKKWREATIKGVQIMATVTVMYTFFYVNWGLNYFRVPLADQTGLDVRRVNMDDYAQVVEKYIHIANRLRDSLDLEVRKKPGVAGDLQEWMRTDTLFQDMLSSSQIRAKSPISSQMISYFAVSGYFNPFTLEAQVNQEIPLASYPFVNVHELAHQMGVGFEDECNFIAFRKLMNHPNDWYRYSAYYETLGYLLYPLRGDQKELYEKFERMLSPKVRGDLAYERAFWRTYSSWLTRLSNIFYNGYLIHNNQPEGLERYGMMARLVVAWEKQQGHLPIKARE